MAAARDVVDTEKSLCASSQIFVATVLTATDTHCFDKNIAWQDETRHGIACQTGLSCVLFSE